VGGPAPNCDDGNICTNDSCNALLGCMHLNNTALCNDGNLCTYSDICAKGVCGGTAYTCAEPNPTCQGDGTCGCGSGTLVCVPSQSNDCKLMGFPPKTYYSCRCGTNAACTGSQKCVLKSGVYVCQ
jgi:hypothetical protein